MRKRLSLGGLGVCLLIGCGGDSTNTITANQIFFRLQPD